jgi:asparagine synthase (glutamine-hydrolysing)
MCGISLIIDKSATLVPSAAIKLMNTKVKHRGPDGEGYYFDQHLAMGHRALKITDFNPTAEQPMHFKDYVIIHNGEVYNYKLIREELRKDGYEFATQSDTEVILAAYDKWGHACTNRFMGMWAFVLYDKRKQLMFCSRDRFGIKPFCYTQLGNRFLAGSEIKQFSVFAEFKPTLNNSVAFDFLYHGQIAETKNSFFEGVYFLPAGHQLIYNLQSHTYTISKWYDMDNITPVKATHFNEAADTFRQLFTDSMLLHTHTKLPIGACLSGGLDSTSITAVAKTIHVPVTTFSTCFVQHGYNEIEYINDASEKYGFPGHKIYPVISDLAENRLLRKIVYHQDQPILGGSFFSEFKIFESVAKNNFRIQLSGQGADEYLGGYREFNLMALLNLWRKIKFNALRKAILHTARNNNKTVKAALKDFMLFGVCARWMDRKTNLDKAGSVYYQALNQLWIKALPYNGTKSTQYGEHSSLAGLSKQALMQYSLPHQLHSEDRNSMLHSVESRLPFLDHRLVEWCLSLPDEFIIRKGCTKAVLREGLKDILPYSIYNRHSKLGFPGPEELLFTHHHHYIQQQFQEFSELFPEIFTRKLMEANTAYFKNKITYDNFLFRALSFGTWAKEFGINGALSLKESSFHSSVPTGS